MLNIIVTRSQFWKGVIKTKVNLKWGLTSIVNNGITLIWEEVWASDIPPQVEFPKLYRICSAKKKTNSFTSIIIVQK